MRCPKLRFHVVNPLLLPERLQAAPGETCRQFVRRKNRAIPAVYDRHAVAQGKAQRAHRHVPQVKCVNRPATEPFVQKRTLAQHKIKRAPCLRLAAFCEKRAVQPFFRAQAFFIISREIRRTEPVL